MAMKDRISKGITRINELASNGQQYVTRRYNETQYDVRVLTTAAEVAQARQAVTGFKTFGTFLPTPVGFAADEHATEMLGNSVFFGAFNRETGELTATARMIWTPHTTADQTRLRMETLTEEGQDAVAELKAGQLADIEYGAVKPRVGRNAAMQLAQYMVKYSTDKGITHWASAIRPATYDRAKQYVKSSMIPLTSYPITYAGVDIPLVPVLVKLEKNLASTVGKHAATVTSKTIAKGSQQVRDGVKKVRANASRSGSTTGTGATAASAGAAGAAYAEQGPLQRDAVTDPQDIVAPGSVSPTPDTAWASDTYTGDAHADTAVTPQVPAADAAPTTDYVPGAAEQLPVTDATAPKPGSFISSDLDATTPTAGDAADEFKFRHNQNTDYTETASPSGAFDHLDGAHNDVDSTGVATTDKVTKTADADSTTKNSSLLDRLHLNRDDKGTNGTP